MNDKNYPDSGVELKGFIAQNYDKVMNIGSIGLYNGFIKKAISDMGIRPDDQILDLGCGTGRNAKLMCSFLNEKGRITGLDISEHMEKQFYRKFQGEKRIEFINQRVDVPFNLQKTYDKVVISFVIHGFPHEIRSTVIQNAFNHLKPGGRFFILDFDEFNMDKMPGLHRFIFKKIECKYAFDFIKRNWKEILNKHGFDNFTEQFYFKKYVRLLRAQKMHNNSEKSILIAIPSNDGKTIFPKMLGMAKYFYIYSTTSSRQFTLVEKRYNPYESSMQHLKTLDVYTVINDCEVIISALIGKKGIERLQGKGVKLIFKKGNIQEALASAFSNE